MHINPRLSGVMLNNTSILQFTPTRHTRANEIGETLEYFNSLEVMISMPKLGDASSQNNWTICSVLS